jgi:hypothetical protein
MTAPPKPPGTAVAKAAPGDELDRLGKLHLAQRRADRALTTALRNETWSKSLSVQMQAAVAEYMRRFKLDISEVEVLGGNIYRTGYYYRRRIAEMRTKGLIEYTEGEMIGDDPRLRELMALTGEDDAEVAAWAKAEHFRRLRERIRWSVPEDATHAYVARAKLKNDARVLEGCDWITPLRTKKVKDWGDDRKFKGWKDVPADPVGTEEPEKTVITRAWRRCGLLVAAEIPELRTDEEAMSSGAEIVEAQIEQIGQDESAREAAYAASERPRGMIASGTPDDPYALDDEPKEKEPVPVRAPVTEPVAEVKSEAKPTPMPKPPTLADLEGSVRKLLAHHRLLASDRAKFERMLTQADTEEKLRYLIEEVDKLITAPV